MSNKILIINYEMGNLFSVYKKLKKIGANAIITQRPEEILKASHLILPGVGHFGKAMEKLSQLNLIEPLKEMVLVKKIPVLGICLGMQLMAQKSEEGNTEGLGWVDAEVKRFMPENKIKFKVPHMGWNTISKYRDCPLMEGIPDKSAFYFVHSYYVESNNNTNIVNRTNYGIQFCSAFQKDNIFGVQYHPEKSHDIGEQLLMNFIKI